MSVTTPRLSDKDFKQKVEQLSKHNFFSTDNSNEIEHDESYTNLSTSVKFRTQALRKYQANPPDLGVVIMMMLDSSRTYHITNPS